MIGPIRVEEISYRQILRHRRRYDAEGLPLTNGYYDGLPEFAADRRHFYAAYVDGRVAGLSALSRHCRDREGREAIYHRSSYTLPPYRRRGVWSAIWTHKLRQISARAWARPATPIWVLTRFGDRRYERRGFSVSGQCRREFRGRVEPFLIWTTSWAELLAHPTTTRALADDVRVHPPESLQVRL